VSVKYKKTFAKVRLKFLTNCAAEYLLKFCLMSRSYQAVGHGVIYSQVYSAVISLITYILSFSICKESIAKLNSLLRKLFWGLLNCEDIKCWISPSGNSLPNIC